MKPRLRQIITALLFTTILPLMGYGKNPSSELKLTLEEAINIAQENNYEILISKAESNVAEADYRQTHALFLPGVELSHTATTTNDPLASFGYKLQQKIVQASDFNPALLNDPDRIENYHSQIMVQQPIINIDGWYGRAAAKSKMKAMQLKSVRTAEYINFNIKQAYFGLQLAHEKQKVLQKAYKATEANYKLTEDNLKQGFVKKADLLAIKVRLLEAENQLKDAGNDINKANEGLTYLLGLPESAVIVPTDNLSTENPFNEVSFSGNRSDVKAMELARDARAKMVKSNKSKLIPNLNAFGAYNINDKELFGTEADSWIVGAKLSWKVFNGNKNLASIKKASAELDIAQNEYEKYVSQQKREFEQAQRNVKLAASKLEASQMAKESAQESFRIRQNRFAEGLEKTSDLITAEATKAAKELEHLYMQYQYNVAVFYLEFLQGK